VTTVDDHVALDAYSQTVANVARVVMPSVVSLLIGTGRPRGAGSGVVITPDGFVLTSAHVVARARAGTAAFTDGRELPFATVGTDPLSDLAVVRVEVPSDHSIQPATLGDAERLVVGQLVVAIGNPLGFTGSVSAGVVSGLGRAMPTQVGGVQRVIEDVIQTDASLHPGNSGGALAMSSGDVVGINTAVVGPGIGQGLGLAVPINAATRDIVGALMRDGRVRRAYLGVAGGTRTLPPNTARRAGQTRGVEITSVVSGSPADRAGLRPGDVLLTVDEIATENVSGLQRLMSSERIDRELVARVWRDGGEMTTNVRPVELPN
jgi:S1-C subfamily serine protease